MIFNTEIGWWFLFLFISFIFSGIEAAFASSDKWQFVMDKAPQRGSRLLMDVIYSRFSRFLSIMMTGKIILLSFFVYFTFLIVYRYTAVALYNDFIKILITIVGATLLLLLANEYLPRILFGKNPDFWVKPFFFFAFLFYLLLYPVAWVFTALSNAILKLCGVNLTESEHGDVFYSVDFDAIIEKNGNIPKETEFDSEVKIFRNALEFSSKKVKECMVPRADIVAVSLDTDLNKLKELFLETGISRILVFKDSLDNIEGYIHIWEIFNHPRDWTNNVASISFVPESMQASRLMSDLMQQRKSIAVVVDEFGSTSGIVTIEDLVEEIFGDIEDEYDIESKFVKQDGENEFVMSGRVEIDHLNESYNLDIPESDAYTTIAGYLLHHTQRFPKTYETVNIGNYTFKILKVTARKIEVVRLTIEK